MTIQSYIVEHVQGSEAWKQHRARSFNASELCVVMGLSSYATRASLMRQKASGVAPEVDSATQRRFDNGHRFEAIARPWAEEIIGQELYPVVLGAEVEGLNLSASLDGLTMDNSIAFEHKTGRADLLASLEAGVIPEEYHPQMEQGMLLSGATRCLFMASSGEREAMRFAWYESRPELRAQIIPTWRQFAADLAAYVPPEPSAAPAPKAEPLETLPAVLVKARGELAIHSNLDAFGQALRAFVAKIPKQPTTDDEFATCDAACSALKRAEEALVAEEARALAGLADVDAMRRAVAALRDLARDTRLASEKLVKARKVQIKTDEIARGRRELLAHCERLNNALDAPFFPRIPEDFAGCISGLKKLDSLRAAIDQHLADKKIEAGDLATRLQKNLRWHAEHCGQHATLFPDLRTLILQDTEPFQAVCSQRVAEHQAAQERRLEAERARIRAEEAARLERQRQAEQTEVAERHLREANAARAQAAAAPVVIPMPAQPSGATLRLGQIVERIAPLSIDASGLARLGFHPVAVDKAAKLYAAEQFPAICEALISHLRAAAQVQKAA